MDLFDVLAILITLTALCTYVNDRYIGLPTTIGVMLIALGLSLLLNLMEPLGLLLEERAVEAWLRQIDFNEAVLHGMLSFLLFAGALHINLHDLVERKWSVGFLATVGVLVSTLVAGTLMWWVLGWTKLGLSYLHCLLFGALISPTDAIAVMGVLKRARVPKALEMRIAGESLFNDGVAVVAFLVILRFLTGSEKLSAGQVGLLFLQESVGGLLLGLGLSALATQMLRNLRNEELGVLITLAVATGGYALADPLRCSGPITVVVAGLVIGNFGHRPAIPRETRSSLDVFWELVDQILNAVLFVLIGLEVLALTFTVEYLLASILVIPVVLFARFLSIGGPGLLVPQALRFSPGAVRILTWGGLRGGVSVALALSIPLGQARGVILAITYAVVVFSLVVQGLTMERLVRRELAVYGPHGL